MTRKEKRDFIQAHPLPDEWNGKRKVYEHVYCTRKARPTQKDARRALRRERWKRAVKNGFYCPGGVYRGVYKSNEGWHGYQQFAKYE